jgi:ATP:corrinoid adenosyltransferase
MSFRTEGFWDEAEGPSSRQGSGSGYLFDGAIRSCNGEILHVIKLDSDRRIAVCEVIDPTLLSAPEKWKPPLTTKELIEVAYDALQPLAPDVARHSYFWPPLPALFSKEARIHAAPPSPLRETIVEALEVVKGLAEEFVNTSALQDSILVSPPGVGAPMILWLRDGVPILGLEISLVGQAPRYVHSTGCPNSESNSPSGGKTGFGLRSSKRAVNLWISYVSSIQTLRARLADNESHTERIISLPPLVRIYMNQSCHCSVVASNPNSVNELSCLSGVKISAVITRVIHVIRRHLEATESKRRLTTAQLQQLAGRLVRYGLTRPTNEPRPITKRAADELRQMMKLKSAVAIRFGPAGSGKTSLLAGIAARMSREGKNVLIVTFTSAAREVIQERIETRTIAVRDKVQCKMLTELLPDRVKKRVLIRSRQTNDALTTVHFSQMFTKSQGSKEQKELNNYDVLLVDEAEDLLPEHWRYLLGPRGDEDSLATTDDYDQVVIVYDDAQSVLSTATGVPRTFEIQGPAEWAPGIFTEQAGEANQGLLRRKWSETKPDRRWLKFNLRQTGVLESHSTKHRQSFRPQDGAIDTGIDSSQDTSIFEKVSGSLSEAVTLALDFVSKDPDCLIVSEARILNMVITLSVDKPNNLMCQEVFIESPSYNFAKPRGNRSEDGVFLEAPLPFDRDHLENPKLLSGEVPDELEDTEIDDGNSQTPALCDFAHKQLWETFSAMRGQVRPLDTRARLLTIPSARGYEANTAIVFAPNPVDAKNFSAQSEYVAITRPQEKLIKIVLPALKTLDSEQSSQARMWRALRRLRAEQDLRGRLWPLVQVDLDRWAPDKQHIDLLEKELPQKVLQWFSAFQKISAELIKKHPDAPQHCLVNAGASAAKANPGFDYAKWIQALRVE